jgi:hypothetical protein
MSDSVGSVQITSVEELPSYLTLMIWGRAGVGKTTLACTAPGKKLIVNFDPDGPSSVAFRDDVKVLDLSTKGINITSEFKLADPFGLSRVLESFDTVIVDSLTSVQELAIRMGVSLINNATLENPTQQGYGIRGVLVFELVRNMLTLCRKIGKHLIFICHEGAPRTNTTGGVNSIPISLGGQLPTNVSIKLSEIWILYDNNKLGETIAVRPVGRREDAKTRMFSTTSSIEFAWNFDPEKTDEEQASMTIADWHKRWLDNNKRKIPLPS